MNLPDRLLFVDVETTGLFSSDRIVSLGLIQLDAVELRRGTIAASYGHWIFDPGKKSHPRAEVVHGYSDWLLRHQDPFEALADELLPLFAGSSLVAAHNASFDHRFIANEFDRAGKALPGEPFFCTMQEYRRRVGGPAGLAAILPRIGRQRAGKTHGAFEDAWLAMEVFLWLHDLPRPPVGSMPQLAPTNLKSAPPPPDSGLPRRSKRKSVSPIAPISEVEITPSTGSAEATEPVPAAPIPASEERERLLRISRPIAALILWIARADGRSDENEVAVMSDYIGSEMERLALPRNAAFEQDLAAEFFELEPTPELVDAAARVIARDREAAARLPGWLRQVTTADGSTSAAERQAINRIAEAFARARQVG